MCTPGNDGCESRAPTVAGVLEGARARLALSRTASLDADLLLAHVLERPRSWILAHQNVRLVEAQLASFESLVCRRAAHEPIAYLRGYVDWYDFRVVVSPAVLVPRPETELLLESAVALSRQRHAQTLVDVGTGSGALAIGLARALPSAQIMAIDASPDAVHVARQNVAQHGLTKRIIAVHGSLLDPVRRQPDVVVANLPYLSDAMMRTRDVDTHFEPEMALRGGESGLDLYQEILVQIARKEWTVPTVLEIDHNQSSQLEEFVATVLPGARVSVKQDYAGDDRVVIVEPR